MSRAARNIQPFIPRETDLAPRTQHSERQWWTMRQLGERLGFSEETIRKKIRIKAIQAQRFGRSVRISEEEAQRLEQTGW